MVVPVACAFAVLGPGWVAPAGADALIGWNVAGDMSYDRIGNPIDDAYNDPDVWSFMRTPVSGETSASALLTRFSEDTACHVSFHGDESNGLPVVGFHHGDHPETCGTVTYPASSVVVQPAANGDNATIRWTSPFSGTVFVHADISDIDPGGGDGVSYQLIDGSGTSVASGTIDNGSPVVGVGVSVDVTEGQSLYLLIGPRGDNDYDSTAVSLDISGHSPKAPAYLGSLATVGKPTPTGAKVKLKVDVRGYSARPLTGTISARGFSCGPLKDYSQPGRAPRARALCTGFFSRGAYSSRVLYSGDANYAPRIEERPFTVGGASLVAGKLR